MKSRLAVLCLLAACSKSEPVKAPKAEYRYEVRSVFVKEHPSFETKYARFSIDGKPVGRDSLGGPSTDFKVPAAQLLVGPSSPLKLEVGSTCGTLHLPLEVFTESNKSEADERKEADGATMGHITGLRVNYTGPWIDEGSVLVDTVGTTGPQTVQVGTLSIEAADGKWAGRTLPIGTCETARLVTHEGKELGQAAPAGKTTVIDVTGGHCYRRTPHTYVRKGADPTKAPKAGPAEVYLSTPEQHVVHVNGKVFSVTGMPSGIAVKDEGQDYEERASLERIACPKAGAKPAKKKKR